MIFQPLASPPAGDPSRGREYRPDYGMSPPTAE